MIAAVNGVAIAGGCELALAADMMVVAEHAEFALSEVTVGLVADAGGIQRLPRRVPPAIASELLLTGRRFSAAEAKAWGLANAIVPGAELMGAARAMAEKIVAAAPLAVSAVKAILSATDGMSIRQAYDYVSSGQVPAHRAMQLSEFARGGDGLRRTARAGLEGTLGSELMTRPPAAVTSGKRCCYVPAWRLPIRSSPRRPAPHFSRAWWMPFSTAGSSPASRRAATRWRSPPRRSICPRGARSGSSGGSFLDRLGGEAAILPRLMALGEIDEDEAAFDVAADGLDLPEAIGPLERRLGLTKLILGWSRAIKLALLPLPGEDEQILIPSSPGDAAGLARDLAHFIDGMQVDRVPFAALARLTDEHAGRYDQHWDLTLRFLEIAAEQWPAFLAERDRIDPVDRRNRLIAADTARIRGGPPHGSRHRCWIDRIRACDA